MGGPLYSLVRLACNTLYPAYASFKVSEKKMRVEMRKTIGGENIAMVSRRGDNLSIYVSFTLLLNTATLKFMKKR
jgi:hypothetical protein